MTEAGDLNDFGKREVVLVGEIRTGDQIEMKSRAELSLSLSLCFFEAEPPRREPFFSFLPPIPSVFSSLSSVSFRK